MSSHLQLLLSISQTIATIRERKALFKIIFGKIKSVIPVDDTGILILDKTGNYWKDWTNADHYQEHYASIRFGQMGFDRWFPMDRFADYTLNHCGIMTVEAFINEYPEHPFGTVMWDAGLREFIFTPLISGGKKLGVLFFDSEKEGTYQQEHLSLFQAIADLLAIAIANILANEEILEREKEKAILLSISEDIAAVRSKEELLGLIIGKVKPLFHFYDCGILVIDNNGQFYDLAAIHPAIDNSEVNHQLNRMGFYQGSGITYAGSNLKRLIAKIEQDKSPVVFDYHADYSAYSTYTDGALLSVLKDLGYQESLFGLLKTGGKTFGCFSINYCNRQQMQQVQIPLFQHVVDQLSVAVANILAGEQILEREKEQNFKLSMVNTLTEDTSWETRLGNFSKLLEEQLPFDYIWFSMIGPNFYGWIMGYQKVRSQIFKSIVCDDFFREGGLDKLTYLTGYNQEQPITATILKGKDLENSLQSRPFTKILIQNFHFQSNLYLPVDLAQAGKFTINMYSYQPGIYVENHLIRLQKLTRSLALTVERLLAYEEVLKQKAEIEARESEKTLQLALVDALTGTQNWPVRFLKLSHLLQPYVPFDFLAILLSDTKTGAEREFQYYRTGPQEYELIDHADFLRINRLSEADYQQLRRQSMPPQAQFFNRVALNEALNENPLKKLLIDTYRLSSHLALPVRLLQGELILSFFSRKAEMYDSHHLAFLQRIQSPLILTIERLVAHEQVQALSEQLRQENTYLQEEVVGVYNFGEIIGKSDALQQVLHLVSQVAETDTTVLILGETGTGKELFARAIHQASSRRYKAMIKLNCAALPAQLIESELFGHEKGAFTGAYERRIGKFELAHGSTIFLDEIGEMPLELQAKLLRAIQEKEIERLGSNKVISCDVRIVAATNRNLEKEVKAGKFRQDLYYRLSVFPLVLPPLRERKEDIELLALHFLNKFARKMGRKVNGISSVAMNELKAYSWPGNIRELEHIIERAVIVTGSGYIKAFSLSTESFGPLQESATFMIKSLEESERETILSALRYTGGRIRGEQGAAKLLQIEPNTLDYRMKRLGIVKEHIVSKKN